MNHKINSLKGTLEKIDDEMKQIRIRSNSQNNDFIDALLLGDDVPKSDEN